MRGAKNYWKKDREPISGNKNLVHVDILFEADRAERQEAIRPGWAAANARFVLRNFRKLFPHATKSHVRSVSSGDCERLLTCGAKLGARVERAELHWGED